MKKTAILLFTVSIISQVVFAGTISGTVTNATSVEGMVLVVAALHAGITDLTSAPMTYIMRPEFPNDYTITSDAIVDFNPYFPVGYMPRGFMPASGDPFGARIIPPTIPIGGSATGADITLFSSGDVGGNISYSGSCAHVFVNVYDYYSYPTPTLESTHFVGARSYHLLAIPSGPKQVQAFDDLNGNRSFDDGEPNGYYTIPIIGLDIVLVTGNVSSSGINITINPSEIEEHNNLPENISFDVFPNPFNSSVSVIFQGLEDSKVRVEIYDISGRKIDALNIENNSSESNWQSGNQTIKSQIVWTPDKSVPSGVYLFIARTGCTKVAEKRAIYLK